MIRAIALRLEGPMQAWGGPVAGDDRPTLDAPTKSGVLGLVAGALGIDRADVTAIASLHEGLALVVRGDRPGISALDFQTILGVPTAQWKIRDMPVISRRGYLYDASFTALLVERAGLGMSLDRIAAALRQPHYLPFLGRKACPPSVPVLLRDPDVREGATWREILDTIPPSGGAIASPELLADAELLPLTTGVTERRMRDVVLPSAPRFFGERAVRRTSNDTTRGWGV